MQVTSWQDILDTLHNLSLSPPTPDTFTNWLNNWSETEKRIRSLDTAYRRATYADTADEAAKELNSAFLKDFIPKVDTYRSQLRQQFLANDHCSHYPVLQARFEAEERLNSGRDEVLVAEHKLLSNQFAVINANLKVSLEDTTLSLGQATAYLRKPERDKRKTAWLSMWQSRFAASHDIDALFLDLVHKRQQIARNAGFPDFRDYCWLERRRFSYTPQHCFAFHDAIEQHVLPVLKKLRRRRTHLLGVDQLRPWDLQVDPFSQTALQPFSGAADLLTKMKQSLGQLDPDFPALLETLERHDMLDLEAREHKVMTVYADHYYDRDLPLMFAFCQGTPYDVHQVFHEFGHALHFRLAASQPLYWLQIAPVEFMEVASQSLELFSLSELQAFYPAEALTRIRFAFLETLLMFLSYIPVVDAFQHWLYTQPQVPQVSELDAKFLELGQRYLVDINYQGLEREAAKGWYFNHLFWQAFYYIEYGFAWIAALDTYRWYRQDPASCLTAFKDSLRSGAQPLPDLYRQLGSEFPVTAEAVARVMTFVESEFADVLAATS